MMGPLQPDELFSAKIQSLCPTITGNVCCTEPQFDTLRGQVQQVRSLESLMPHIGFLLNHKYMQDSSIAYLLWISTYVFHLLC